jgi:hypothetical protein
MGNLTPELFEAAGIPVAERKPVPPATPAQVETDLDHLAAQIRAGHKATQATMRNAVTHALDVGDTLIAAKKRIPEGQWRTWLDTKCSIEVRTAQLYMQLARHRDRIEACKERPGLSLRAARRLIMDDSKAKRQSPKPAEAPSKDAPKIPEWERLYNEATDEDKALGISHIIIDLFTHMSATARAKLTERVLGNAAEHAPTKKQRNAIRRAQKQSPYLDDVSYSRININ